MNFSQFKNLKNNKKLTVKYYKKRFLKIHTEYFKKTISVDNRFFKIKM